MVKNNFLKGTKMIFDKEKLTEHLSQVTQAIENTEAALQGMRSYKAFLEAGVNSFTMVEELASAPMQWFESWGNMWGAKK
jgi:hypothetical protein